MFSGKSVSLMKVAFIFTDLPLGEIGWSGPGHPPGSCAYEAPVDRTSAARPTATVLGFILTPMTSTATLSEPEAVCSTISQVRQRRSALYPPPSGCVILQ